MVWVFDQLVDVPAIKIQQYRPAEVSLKANKNKNEHGIMELSFSCRVFNASGFYTRCLAIPVADL